MRGAEDGRRRSLEPKGSPACIERAVSSFPFSLFIERKESKKKHGSSGEKRKDMSAKRMTTLFNAFSSSPRSCLFWNGNIKGSCVCVHTQVANCFHLRWVNVGVSLCWSPIHGQTLYRHENHYGQLVFSHLLLLKRCDALSVNGKLRTMPFP